MRSRFPSAFSIVGLAVGLGACRGDTSYAERTIEDPWGRWSREGFVQLTTTSRAPSSSAVIDQVEIWLKLPDGARVRGTQGVNGPTLTFPPGCEIDRVEYTGHDEKRQVIDVRGTRIDEAGRQHFHNFRKQRGGRSSPMFGFEWPRDDAGATAAATDAFTDRLRKTPPGKNMNQDAADGYVGRMRAKNDCLGCHVLDRAANDSQGQHGLVNRGTDASGFFSPLATLLDDVPVERYGAHDRNLEDPHVSVSCSSGDVSLSESGRPHCPKRRVPLAHVDIAAGVRAGQAHAQAVCASRRFLFEHLDAAGRALFAQSVAACEPGSEIGKMPVPEP